jgi:hypothetical protein
MKPPKRTPGTLASAFFSCPASRHVSILRKVLTASESQGKIFTGFYHGFSDETKRGFL